MQLLILQLLLHLLQHAMSQLAGNGIGSGIQPGPQITGNNLPGMPHGLSPMSGSTFQSQGTTFQGAQNSLQPMPGTQFQTVPISSQIQPQGRNTLNIGENSFQAAPGTSLKPFQGNSIQPVAGPSLHVGQPVSGSSLQPVQNLIQNTDHHAQNPTSNSDHQSSGSNAALATDINGSIIQMNGQTYILEDNGKLMAAPDLSSLVGSTVKNGQVVGNPFSGLFGQNNSPASSITIGPNGQLLNGSGNALFPTNPGFSGNSVVPSNNFMGNGLMNNAGSFMNGMNSFNSNGMPGNGQMQSNNLFPRNGFTQNNAFPGNGLVQQPNAGFGFNRFNGNGGQTGRNFVGSPVTRVNQIPMRFPGNPDPRMAGPPIPGRFNAQFRVPQNNGMFPMQMNRQMPPDPRQMMQRSFPRPPPFGRQFPFPGPPRQFGPPLPPRGPQRFGPMPQRAG